MTKLKSSAIPTHNNTSHQKQDDAAMCCYGMFFKRTAQVGLVVITFIMMFVTCQRVSAADISPGTAQQRLPAQLYVTRELSFVNGQTTLAGTLYLPNGAGPFPGVVLLHGSGPDTRVPYRSDARMFAEAGIAALIYDKRGTGESTGNWQMASLHELAADALVAARRLREQSEIQADKVGLWGVSQGGWLSPLAAPRDPQLAFIVQVTSAAMPLANQEMWGVGNELRGLGFSDGAIRTAMKGMHLFFSLRPLVHRL
ncbi:alpha/beta fold hydrolase [Chloroflexi bacterium TSY]|nr:alpha/beta fold hydrolase [Chloroflexi bacterium TSY]